MSGEAGLFVLLLCHNETKCTSHSQRQVPANLNITLKGIETFEMQDGWMFWPITQEESCKHLLKNQDLVGLAAQATVGRSNKAYMDSCLQTLPSESRTHKSAKCLLMNPVSIAWSPTCRPPNVPHLWETTQRVMVRLPVVTSTQRESKSCWSHNTAINYTIIKKYVD